MSGKKGTSAPKEVTLESLAADFAKQAKQIEAQGKTIAELYNVNKALGAELKKKGTSEPAADKGAKGKTKVAPVVKPLGTLKYEGKEYRFTLPKVKVLGKEILTAAIIENPELYEAEIAVLVKNAPGALIEKV